VLLVAGEFCDQHPLVVVTGLVHQRLACISRAIYQCLIVLDCHALAVVKLGHTREHLLHLLHFLICY
jgi:hypothetical protein